jgi:hypothetical protein
MAQEQQTRAGNAGGCGDQGRRGVRCSMEPRHAAHTATARGSSLRQGAGRPQSLLLPPPSSCGPGLSDRTARVGGARPASFGGGGSGGRRVSGRMALRRTRLSGARLGLALAPQRELNQRAYRQQQQQQQQHAIGVAASRRVSSVWTKPRGPDSSPRRVRVLLPPLVFHAGPCPGSRRGPRMRPTLTHGLGSRVDSDRLGFGSRLANSDHGGRCVLTQTRHPSLRLQPKVVCGERECTAASAEKPCGARIRPASHPTPASRRARCRPRHTGVRRPATGRYQQRRARSHRLPKTNRRLFGCSARHTVITMPCRIFLSDCSN